MSIRYKFIISLLALTGFCLAIYIWIAKSVFEKDKQVAVFESASKTSTTQAFTLKKHLDEEIEFAKYLIPLFSETSESPSGSSAAVSAGVGLSLFNKKPDLLTMGVLENKRWLVFQSKDAALTADTLLQKLETHAYQPAILLESTGLLVFSMPLKSAVGETSRKLVAVIRLQEELDSLRFTGDAGGSFLALGEEPISLQASFPSALAKSLLAAVPFQSNMTERTGIQRVAQEDYLISTKTLSLGQLRVFTVVPKTLAFRGLNVLYLKSMQFFCLIFCLVLIVSVLMTQSLLKNLDRIILATNQISRGHFDFRLAVKAKDEFGHVANSFQHMAGEIKRLLTETKEKTRMEAELKTAQTVQENLFPSPTFSNGFVEIHGLYRSASECGGDWWYHFEHPTGLYVFICDATGHGAPAALITAAAKAAVNLTKRDANLTLLKLVEAFNFALYETAKGNILMTGFVLQIKQDQSIEYVNASHEPPLLFNDGAMEFVMDPIGPRFGQASTSLFKVGTLPSLSGQLMLMYTDGITSQLNADGREVGDRRFTKFLQKFEHQTVSLDEVNAATFQLVDDFREQVPQADDLTIVSIRFPANANSEVLKATAS